MKTNNLVIIIIIFLFSKTLVHAQININCSGKQFYIPSFSKDSTGKSFIEKKFEESNFLEPVEKSKYDIEIRACFVIASFSMASFITVKGNDKELVAESRHYLLQKDKNDTIAPAGYQTLRWLNRNLYLSVKRIPLTCNFIDSLIHYKFFSRPDAGLLIDSLKKANVRIEAVRAFDPYMMRFEVKVNNQFRSFYCAPFEWAANKNIAELTSERALFKLFDNLYIKTGQTGNHLFP